MKNKLIVTSILVVMSVALLGCDSPKYPNVKTLLLNQQAIKSLENKETQKAYLKFVEALQYDPFLSGLHLNLGFTLELTEQAEKALQAYREAEKLALASNEPMLVFVARFNQAQLLGKAKQIDAALEKYQQALEISPSSTEVKTNIELLIKSQQGGDKGEGENKDSEGEQDQKNQGQGKGDQQKDQPDKEDEKEKKENQSPQKSEKYKPRPFKGQELSEGDVKKILGELKQQEEKIRAEFNKKESKEQPRDKDW